jgi:DNA polymerase epsilon subunit 1
MMLYLFVYFFRISRGHKESDTPSDIAFEVRIEIEERLVYRQIQRTLQSYRDEKRGPTMLIVQSAIGIILNFNK